MVKHLIGKLLASKQGTRSNAPSLSVQEQCHQKNVSWRLHYSPKVNKFYLEVDSPTYAVWNELPDGAAVLQTLKQFVSKLREGKQRPGVI